MDYPSTLYTDMKNVNGEDYVVAYHVCPQIKLQAIKDNLTAGGSSPSKPDVGAPTEEQCRKQVGFERAPWAPSTPREVVEFGVGERPKYSGLPGSACAVFRIKAKYLRQGSGSEGGWCAYPNAPIKWGEHD